MRLLTIALILSVILALADELRIAYVDVLTGRIKLVRVESERSVEGIFESLTAPPLGFTSCVPKGVLRVHFRLKSLQIVDLNSESMKDMSFDEERCFLHQVLMSIFANFEDVEDVKILVDGGKRSTLVKYVDVRFSFPRELWQFWPQR